VALTRTPEKLRLLRDLGAEAELCDVYDYPALLRIAREARPQVVVNFVTDLAAGRVEANARARREGGANVAAAAEAVSAARLVVESVAFPLEGEAGRAVRELERTAREFSGGGVVLRFGRLWGPGTAYATPAEPPTIHVERAGAEAARLVVDASSKTYTIT
jgi:hypothetical protein